METSHHEPPGAARFVITVAAALALFIVATLLFLWLARTETNSLPRLNTAHSNPGLRSQRSSGTTGRASLASSRPQSRTPEQIVADKLISFGASRRQVVRDIARHYGETIPEEVQRFFNAVEAGNWPETERLFELMAKRSGQYDQSGPADPALNHFWPAVLDTFGVAEQVHDVPAPELLKFGEDVLGAVPSGSVYIGGTDAGRFIPTLLAETGSGDQPMVITQNALCDSRYLEYIQFLHGDRLKLPTREDADRMFAEYSADARKRLEHDEQFPNEPKQVRHLENLKLNGNKLDVSGPTAVMDMNERLLKFILEKNPEYGFALQESMALRGTYAEATPAGPIMELRSRDASEPLSAEAAGGALDYWRNTVSGFNAAPPSEETQKNYSHMAVAHGNLLAHHGHPAAAEQTYQLSFQIHSRNIDTLLNYRQFLIDQRRESEAARLVETFRNKHPDLDPQLEKWLPPGN